MRYRLLPRTDLHVSALCLGAGNFGSSLTEAESFAILDAFVERGGNFLDTARVYAAWLPGGMGISERIIGTWLKQRGLQQAMIVATKGAHPELSAMHVPRLGREQIVQDCEESLKQLGLDAIPLYWLHRDDETRPVSDILQGMETLVAEGKIRWYGCSNWSVERLEAATQFASQNGLTGFVANQPLWSLAQVNPASVRDVTMKWMGSKMLNFHRQTALPAVPYSSQAKGFFSKANASGMDGLPDALRESYDNPQNRQLFTRLQVLSKETGWSISTLSLAYLTSQPDFVTIPIIGAHQIAQLDDSVMAGEVELSSDMQRYLAEVK